MGGRLVQHSNTSLCLVTKMGIFPQSKWELGSLHKGATACKGGSRAMAARFGGSCEPGCGLSKRRRCGEGSKSAGGNWCLLDREMQRSLGQQAVAEPGPK